MFYNIINYNAVSFPLFPTIGFKLRVFSFSYTVYEIIKTAIKPLCPDK